MQNGTGLINLDYHLNSWKELFEPLQIERIEKENKTSLVKIGEEHYINELHPHPASPIKGEGLEFLKVKIKNRPLLLAEFSPHAFSDPKNINEHPIYMLHNGKEFSPEELKKNFARVDKKFVHWKIKQSKTVNAHFGEIGVNSLPFLKEQGIKFTMQPGVPFGYNWAGAAEGKHPEWSPFPYGNHGFNYDEMLNHPEFFNVVSHPLGNYKLKERGIGSTDFLWGNTIFWNESKFNNIHAAAEKGADIIKLGLDSGFFGCLMTHEQRIATLSTKEFKEILKRIDGLLSDHEKIFASYDKIAEYIYNHSQSKLKEEEKNG